MLKKIGILIFILLFLGIFFFINPGEVAFMPKCLFHWLTGLNCPACGTQRALHQLLHLHLREAWEYNLFLVISLPYALALIVSHWFNPNHRFDQLKAFCHRRAIVNTYLILFTAWWIIRNILGI